MCHYYEFYICYAVREIKFKIVYKKKKKRRRFYTKGLIPFRQEIVHELGSAFHQRKYYQSHLRSQKFSRLDISDIITHII